MDKKEVDKKEVDEWLRNSRAKQGLPPRITDPSILAKVAAIIAASERSKS